MNYLNGGRWTKQRLAALVAVIGCRRPAGDLASPDHGFGSSSQHRSDLDRVV
jgi:hypothetical protein